MKHKIIPLLFVILALGACDSMEKSSTQSEASHNPDSVNQEMGKSSSSAMAIEQSDRPALGKTLPDKQ